MRWSRRRRVCAPAAGLFDFHRAARYLACASLVGTPNPSSGGYEIIRWLPATAGMLRAADRLDEPPCQVLQGNLPDGQETRHHAHTPTATEQLVMRGK